MNANDFDSVPSCFLAFEGGDACGKATQSSTVYNKICDLWKKNRDIRIASHKTFVPRPDPLFMSFPRYETQLGQAIERHLKKKTQLVELDASTEGRFPRAPEDALAFQCMMQVDRDLAGPQIRDHLAQGGHVISDRWNKSGYVYGTMDGCDPKYIEPMGGCLPQPDLHLLLDVPVEVAMKRRPVARDRYEASAAKRGLVRDLYLGLWRERMDAEPGRWAIVDGDRSVEVVTEDIWGRVMMLFRMRSAMKEGMV